MSGIYGNTTVSLHAFGLTPSTKYCASFQFTADDGTGGYNLGATQQPVKSNGTIMFENDATDVNPDGVAGTVLMWLRAGSATGGNYDDPPEKAPDGTVLQASVHLP